MLWTPPEPRTLKQMHRYETRYEILITINGETERAGFTNRVSQQTLLEFARKYREYILPTIFGRRLYPVQPAARTHLRG